MLLFNWNYNHGSAIGMIETTDDEKDAEQELCFVNCAAFQIKHTIGSYCAMCYSRRRDFCVPDGVEVRARIIVGSLDRREAAPVSITYTSDATDGKIISWYKCAIPDHHHDEREKVKKFASTDCDKKKLKVYVDYLQRRGVRIIPSK